MLLAYEPVRRLAAFGVNLQNGMVGARTMVVADRLQTIVGADCAFFAAQFNLGAPKADRL